MRAHSGRATAFGLALGLASTLACATIEAPTGGPVDETPPVLAASSPDSGSVGLAPFDRFELVFSEKVQPLPAERILKLYPPLEIRKSGWSGRRRLVVELAGPVPADTVLLIEIPAGLTDVHRVRSAATTIVPLATAAAFPPGVIHGVLREEEGPAGRGVVELFALPPDSLEWFQQDPLRRAAADSLGRFALRWLPVPGGPWLLRAFTDLDGDMRPGEKEGQRLLPDTFAVSFEGPERDAGAWILYDPRTPGRIVMPPVDPDPWTGAVCGWSMRIAEEDSGWTPSHGRRIPRGLRVAAPGDSAVWPDAGPGPTRLILFVDVDGDSLHGALPDSLAADSVTWSWEPFVLVEDLDVPPGLDLAASAPRFPAELTAASAPPAIAIPDSAAARGDSTVVGEPQSAATDSLAGGNPPDPTLEETP